jgi:hypothetical protein
MSQPRTLRLDDTGDITYIGEADAGALTDAGVWRIKRVTESGEDLILDWADGDEEFDNIWDNRLSLTYL